MTAEPDNDPSREAFTAQEPARRNGSIVLVLLVAAGLLLQATQALTGIGPGLVFLAREDLGLRWLRRMERPEAVAVVASPNPAPYPGRS